MDKIETKKLKTMLHESEEKYRILVENTDDVILLTDLNGKHLFRNKAYYTSLGYEDSSPIDTDGWSIVHPDDLPIIQNKMSELLEKGKLSTEYRVRHKDGHWVYRFAKSSVVFDKGHKPNAILVIIRDITERKLGDLELRESEERFRRLVEFSPYGISIHSDGIIVFANQEGAKILRVKDPEYLIGKYVIEFVHPDYREIVMKRIQLQKKGITASLLEEKLVRIDGTIVDVELMSIPIVYKGKQSFYNVFHDITERKLAEDIIKASLKEKEILLKEIHHRVKNNMQVISSLLGLVSINIKDEKYLEMFVDSQNRINSMALIHEKLYSSKNLAKIDLNDYIRDLANSLFHSRKVAGRIELLMKIENVSLDIDNAIPCGLIINELMTNSLKHAFPGNRNGQIKVSAYCNDENMIELIFSDNGVGIPSDIDFRNTRSLGLHLVTMLAENQLHGRIDLNRTGGTEFKIIFKWVK